MTIETIATIETSAQQSDNIIFIRNIATEKAVSTCSNELQDTILKA